MSGIIEAMGEFVAQPFGAVGAVCIMLAVTVINSTSLQRRIGLSDAAMGHAFNGLNLIGGSCLFINAVQRSEVVWVVLEVYFVAIALKGITQAVGASAQATDEPAATNAVSEPQPA